MFILENWANEEKGKWKKQKPSVIPLPRWPLWIEGSLGVSLCPPPPPFLTCHRFLQVKFVGQWIWTWSSWYRLPAAFYVPCSWSRSYLLWDRLSHGGLQGAVNFTPEKDLFDCILSSHSDSLLATGVIEKLCVRTYPKPWFAFLKSIFPAILVHL